MRSDTMIPAELANLLTKKYNIIGNIEFKQFDYNWDNLRSFFRYTKKTKFDHCDRYVIEHQDTDIYLAEMSVGLNLRNFFEVVRELDIPLFTILIWTNHFGLQKELDILHGQSHVKDRPTVIESFCACTHMADNYVDQGIAVDEIQHHAISMMGVNRSHRFALYHALKHFDPEKLAMSIRGTK